MKWRMMFLFVFLGVSECLLVIDVAARGVMLLSPPEFLDIAAWPAVIPDIIVASLPWLTLLLLPPALGRPSCFDCSQLQTMLWPARLVDFDMQRYRNRFEIIGRDSDSTARTSRPLPLVALDEVKAATFDFREKPRWLQAQNTSRTPSASKDPIFARWAFRTSMQESDVERWEQGHRAAMPQRSHSVVMVGNSKRSLLRSTPSNERRDLFAFMPSGGSEHTSEGGLQMGGELTLPGTATSLHELGSRHQPAGSAAKYAWEGPLVEGKASGENVELVVDPVTFTRTQSVNSSNLILSSGKSGKQGSSGKTNKWESSSKSKLNSSDLTANTPGARSGPRPAVGLRRDVVGKSRDSSEEEPVSFDEADGDQPRRRRRRKSRHKGDVATGSPKKGVKRFVRRSLELVRKVFRRVSSPSRIRDIPLREAGSGSDKGRSRLHSADTTGNSGSRGRRRGYMWGSSRSGSGSAFFRGRRWERRANEGEKERNRNRIAKQRNRNLTGDISQRLNEDSQVNVASVPWMCKLSPLPCEQCPDALLPT